MRQSAGTFLKERRENRKIAIKQAAEDINMTSRHIQALEDDNYSIFPGETYALGFLRSYATYLDVDPDQVIQLYRGAQLVEKEVPLQELTKPTMTPLDQIQPYLKYVVAVLIIAAIGVVGYNFLDRTGNNSSETTTSNNKIDVETFVEKGSTRLPEVKTENLRLRGGFATAVIGVGKGIDFSVQNTEIFLVLKSLNFKQGTDGQSQAQLLRYPGRIEVPLVEGKPVVVKDNNIPRQFTLTLMGATPNNIKLQITMGSRNQTQTEENITENNENKQNNTPIVDKNFLIRFHAETTADNFVEFYVDGVPKQKGLLGANSVLHYEAEDSIQFKIGDAGAIDIQINGKKYNWGKPGQQIKKIIRKVKDPVKQSISIEIKDI